MTYRGRPFSFWRCHWTDTGERPTEFCIILAIFLLSAGQHALLRGGGFIEAFVFFGGAGINLGYMGMRNIKRNTQ